MRTYLQGDEEITCGCNYFTDPLIIDRENESIYCSVCGHKELLPSYHEFFTDAELTKFYTDPKKKVYDFGEHGISVPANMSVINFVRDHLKSQNLL